MAGDGHKVRRFRRRVWQEDVCTRCLYIMQGVVCADVVPYEYKYPFFLGDLLYYFITLTTHSQSGAVVVFGGQRSSTVWSQVCDTCGR